MPVSPDIVYVGAERLLEARPSHRHVSTDEVKKRHSTSHPITSHAHTPKQGGISDPRLPHGSDGTIRDPWNAGQCCHGASDYVTTYIGDHGAPKGMEAMEHPKPWAQTREFGLAHRESDRGTGLPIGMAEQLRRHHTSHSSPGHGRFVSLQNGWPMGDQSYFKTGGIYKADPALNLETDVIKQFNARMLEDAEERAIRAAEKAGKGKRHKKLTPKNIFTFEAPIIYPRDTSLEKEDPASR
ncbi:hypothetical protein K505DRAFT_359873 [Melanomma pulvis-pyrius CBS 109.77]|uniref:Uncharacterized protein n=1 Tax=Melanomma pulvis-pyrius CBS 109.77 TaxID=1314802 RepID=A0A6A6XH87_9PLEO|nr:hypothetical protein K505DRAFT_359873 [Melanomma pulvis-pyrius CBS 109.77]